MRTYRVCLIGSLALGPGMAPEPLQGKKCLNMYSTACFTQSQGFYYILYLSGSASAEEDRLISDAPGLRFKHLFAPLPISSFLTLSASQCVPE